MKRNGYSLVSVALAIVILAVSAVAVMQAMAGASKANAVSGAITQAVFLATNVHEYAMTLSVTDPNSNYARAVMTPPDCLDITDLDTSAQSPQFVSCIDAHGNPLPATYARWKQRRTVTSFALSAPGAIVAASDTTARLLTVDIEYDGTTIYTISWVFAPTMP